MKRAQREAMYCEGQIHRLKQKPITPEERAKSLEQCRNIGKNLDKCLNCGEAGAHFVPPSMGEEGFYFCEKKEIKA